MMTQKRIYYSWSGFLEAKLKPVFIGTLELRPFFFIFSVRIGKNKSKIKEKKINVSANLRLFL